MARNARARKERKKAKAMAKARDSPPRRVCVAECFDEVHPTLMSRIGECTSGIVMDFLGLVNCSSECESTVDRAANDTLACKGCDKVYHACCIPYEFKEKDNHCDACWEGVSDDLKCSTCGLYPKHCTECDECGVAICWDAVEWAYGADGDGVNLCAACARDFVRHDECTGCGNFVSEEELQTIPDFADFPLFASDLLCDQCRADEALLARLMDRALAGREFDTRVREMYEATRGFLPKCVLSEVKKHGPNAVFADCIGDTYSVNAPRLARSMSKVPSTKRRAMLEERGVDLDTGTAYMYLSGRTLASADQVAATSAMFGVLCAEGMYTQTRDRALRIMFHEKYTRGCSWEEARERTLRDL